MVHRLQVFVCLFVCLMFLTSCARQPGREVTQNPISPSAGAPELADSIARPRSGDEISIEAEESTDAEASTGTIDAAPLSQSIGEWTGGGGLDRAIVAVPQLLEAPEVANGLRLITFSWRFTFRRPAGSNLYKVYGYFDTQFDRLTLPRGTRLRAELTYSGVGALYTVRGGETRVRFNLPSYGFTSACPVPRNLRDVFRIVNLSRSQQLFRVAARWSAGSRCG